MTLGWWALVLSLLGSTPALPEPPAPDLPTSHAPRIGYVDGHTLRLPDGAHVQLPKRWGVTAIERYAGGYLVADDRVFEGTVGMAKLDARGRVLDQWSGTGAPLVSRDGRVAWVSLSVSEADQHGPTVLHADSVDGGHETTQRISRTRVPFLTGWWQGRLVYRTWGDRSSHVTDLVAPPEAVPLAEELGEPSPDGSMTARVTGRGIEFRQADGQLVNEIRNRGLTRTQVNDLAWEDRHHLLTTLTQGRRMCVVRVSDSGRLTRTTPWRRADATGFAFLAK